MYDTIPVDVQMKMDADMQNALMPPPVFITAVKDVHGTVLWNRYQVQSTGQFINSILNTPDDINMRAAEAVANSDWNVLVLYPWYAANPLGSPGMNAAEGNKRVRDRNAFINDTLKEMNLPPFPFPPVFGP